MMSHLVEVPSRFFTENGFWYFRTREGVSVGPFDNMRDANLGLSEYLQFAQAYPQQFAKWFGSGRAA